MNSDMKGNNGWIETTLGEISKEIAYGYTESSTLEKVGPKFLRITDIQEDFINWDSVPYCPISDRNHVKYKLEIGDVVIARTGNSTGATAVIKDNIDAVFASYLIRFKIDSSKANHLFIDFLLRSNYWKGFVKSIKGGSAQGGANARNFSEFPISLPPLSEQNAIAAVLSSFDNKIELLRQQNQNLEAMAQTIFKEWFVDFRFPGAGKMINSELGMIPEGWRVDNIGKYVNIKGGTTPSTKNPDFWNGNIHWTSPKDLSNMKQPYLLSTEKKITEAGLKKISSGLLPKGTLLFSSRAPIGYIALSDIEVAINQGYIAFLSDAPLSNYFMFNWLKQNADVVVGAANGSTFLEISKSSFKSISTVIPKKEIIGKFDDMVTPIFKKILNNSFQIQTLSKLRDSLLPKLMSGEVRVKTIENKKPLEQ